MRLSAVVAAGAVLLLLIAACDGSNRQPAETPPKESRESNAFPSRTPDGQPDIQGLWAGDLCNGPNLPCPPMNLETTNYLRTQGLPGATGSSISGGVQASISIAKQSTKRDTTSIILDPPDHVLPYRPWAKARRDAVMRHYEHPSRGEIDTNSLGWPTGIPRQNYYSSRDGSLGGPFQILQPAGYVVFFYETHHEFRIIPLDGRAHVGQDIKLWSGDSRGRWEGNTLIVDVTNSNDSTRFSLVGDFHSDAMHVAERWTFTDRKTLDYKATIDDPTIFSAPWTIGVQFTREPAGTELLEYNGVEGELSIANLLGPPSSPARKP
jgi:hypothetical protein